MKTTAILVALTAAISANAAPALFWNRQVIPAVSSAIGAAGDAAAAAATDAVGAAEGAVAAVTSAVVGAPAAAATTVIAAVGAAATGVVVGVETVFGARTTQIVVQTQVPAVDSLVITRQVETQVLVTAQVPQATQIATQVVATTAEVIVGVPVPIATKTQSVIYGDVTRYSQVVVPTIVTQFVTQSIPYVVQTTQTVAVDATYIGPAPVVSVDRVFTQAAEVPGITLVNEIVPTQTVVNVVEVTAAPEAPPA